MSRTTSRLASTLALPMLLDMPAMAQKAYDQGATDTEIKIGNLTPYSGPGSSYGVTAKAEAAYFRMINESGGINERKINFISYDDAFLPPKAVEQVRKLVEGDEALLIFQSLGTPSNVAIQKYLNQRKVPHLFVGSGATRWGGPKSFPGPWVGSRITRARVASTHRALAWGRMLSNRFAEEGRIRARG